jgi:pyrroline-5-carboxylate reductase
VSTLAGPIWLIGCGAMGGAMLRRWVASGIDPERITVIDPGSPDLPEGVRLARAEDLYEGEFAEAETLVLAVKPQQLAAVADGPLSAVTPRLLISILAGVEERSLAARWQAGAVVRAMPNLPVAIGQGVTALHSSSTDPDARAAAESLARPLGLVEWIGDEALFDAVTALSGCGPGFVYRFIDAMAAAGAALGLPAEQALRLAVATVAGSGALAAAADAPPSLLADRVASPGGSTREGLNVLDRDTALARLLADTLAASARRNAELAALAR